jgi:hypothetical protein
VPLQVLAAAARSELAAARRPARRTSSRELGDAVEETRGTRERENGGVGVVEKGGDDMCAQRVVVGIEWKI